MRQYRIVTKTPLTEEVTLIPGVHASLYNIPEIRDAVAFLEEQLHIEMIGIRLGSRFYGIVVMSASKLHKNHFQLSNFDEHAE